MKPAPPLQRKPLPAALSLEVTYCAPDELIQQATNPRSHSPKQIQQIARSIRHFGFLTPILRDAKGVVLAGHGRLLAARELGITSVPTVVVDHLTSAQKTAFLIADNKISLNATWDEALLAEHFAALAAGDLHFDLSLTGFEMGEIDLIVRGADAPSAEPEEPPMVLRPPVAKPGEIWALGPHRVMCGNALEAADYARVLGNRRANVAFTDPPYNCKVSSISGLGRVQHREFAMASGEMSRREYTDFLRRAFDLMATHSEPGAIHFICNDWKHIAEMTAAGEASYAEFKNLCVWAKDAGGMGSLYRSQHELIFVFKVGGGAHQNHVQLGRYGRNRTNLWAYPSANSFARSADDADLLTEHPTPKNVAMIADALMDVSSRGDVVLDPFLGSGSTVIAAERVGRIAYGLELDPRYVDLTIRRWQRATGKSAVNLALQCTFDELEEQREVSHD